MFYLIDVHRQELLHDFGSVNTNLRGLDHRSIPWKKKSGKTKLLINKKTIFEILLIFFIAKLSSSNVLLDYVRIFSPLSHLRLIAPSGPVTYSADFKLWTGFHNLRIKSI